MMKKPRIERIIREVLSSKARVGAIITDVDYSEILTVNADEKFLPASAVKLFTAATALHILHPNFRYETGIFYTGEIRDKELKGDLVIRGSGDPTLTSSRLGKIAGSIARELKIVHGDIIIDSKVFDGGFVNKAWLENTLSYPYIPRIAGFLVDKGMIKVTILPGKDGSPPIVKTFPKSRLVRVENRAVTGKSKPTRLEVLKEEEANSVTIVVKGTINIDEKGALFQIPLERPNLFAGLLFKESLKSAGVSVEGNVTEGTLVDGMLLELIPSRSLSDILKLLLRHDDHLIAEHLLKTLGYYRYGKGDWEYGIKSIKSLLKTLSIPDNELVLVDGSGISKDNRATPRSIAELLFKIRKRRYFKNFYRALPVAGISGALRERLINTNARGRIIALACFTAEASSLSGYVKTLQNRELIFSIIINNPKVPLESLLEAVDKMCLSLVEDF
ncbi:MAG: D-alanyl-D-alanine carboxypeptidase/D-alanyl-D-alanine-endopeptidase [Thermoprotei archaeon]|nr:MAG: D-alanyl-D-alanine carboxypeptidase/D-alanyl-D-alanine-endopeptidase [Thermoprotei archaeon]RLF03529.1 MAG: D-alanyl-D-alanine carboxypeptidase/D-alanyl-D-alanine-endopeptidase [Thermoprotei archaeon]